MLNDCVSYYMSGSLLGIGDIAVNHTDEDTGLGEMPFSDEKTNSKPASK